MTRNAEKPDRRHLLLVPLAAFIAIHPLLVHGCSCGHDFDFHLVNWVEAASQFSHGNLYPHWAFSPAFNAGEPRFVFYPPISWALGALLGLLLTHLPGVAAAAGWTAVPILFTWIALTLSGFTMHRLAREFSGCDPALFAAILYLANPYMMFTGFERTAYAELLAAAWIPLLLLGILRKRVTVPGIALPLAMLWLTNAPAALMGSYTLAALALMRITHALLDARKLSADGRRDAHYSIFLLALRTAAGTLVGLGLAAFYVLPAAYERRFVQIAMATIGGMRLDQNFLFEHTGNSPDSLLHDQVLHTASTIAVILLFTAIACIIALVLLRQHDSELAETQHSQLRSSIPIVPLAILTAGIALLLTPISAPIWSHAPQATFLQFPWRLLAILAPLGALLLAAAVDRLALNSTASIAAGLLVNATLAFAAYRQFHQECDPEDTPRAQYVTFVSHAGIDPTDEYTSVDADNDSLRQGSPGYWLAESAAADAPSNSTPGAAPLHLIVTAPHAEFLILNLRNFPAWRISINGSLDPVRDQRNDGLIALPIRAGASTIELRYAHTRDESEGDAITMLAGIALLVPLALRRTRSTA